MENTTKSPLLSLICKTLIFNEADSFEFETFEWVKKWFFIIQALLSDNFTYRLLSLRLANNNFFVKKASDKIYCI